MKKALIGLSALVILSFAVLLFVNAKSVTLKSKKACTEAVVKCPDAGECAGVKCEKTASAENKDCDPANCPKADCPEAKDCPKAKEAGCKMQAAAPACPKACPLSAQK